MQAAAAARVVGKEIIFAAAELGDIAVVQDYIIADASCVSELVRHHYPNLYEPLDAPTSACISLFAKLISCSIRTTPLDVLEKTLRHANEANYPNIVQLLLSCNVDVDTRNDEYHPYAFIVDEDALLIFKLYSASDV